MAVCNHLPGLCARIADPKTETGVIQPALQKGEQVFTGNPLHFLSHFKIFMELGLQNAVSAFHLLLFTKLGAVLGHFTPGLSMLAGRYLPLCHRTFAGIATVALQKELCPFPAA
jgi:hypothetical protein